MSRRPKAVPTEGANLGRAAGIGALIGTAAFLVSLAVASFALAAYAKNYLRSVDFRDKVSGGISAQLKARAELAPVRWQGASAYSDRFRAQGHEDAAFGLLELSGTRVELDLSAAQFRRGVWKVPEVVISQVLLDLTEAVKLPGSYPVAASPPFPSPENDTSSSGGMWRRLIPSRVEMDQVRIGNFNLVWSEGGKLAQAVGITTEITPSSTGEAFDVVGRGGAIHRPGQAKLDIDRIVFRFRDGGFYVTESIVRTQQGAELRVEGDIVPGKGNTPGSLLLRARADHLKLSDVVQESWEKRVSGDLRVTAKIEGDPARPEDVAVTGTVHLDNGVLEAFPILDTLATYTGTERFRRVALRDGGSATFTRKGQHLIIEKIDLQSDGLARLTGAVSVTGKSLSGNLRLGVVPGTMNWLPGAEQKVFLETGDGYVWTDIVLSGTVDDPRNDLVGKLASAGAETVIEAVKDPAAVKQSVEDAIGVGRDLFRGFFGR